MSPRANGSPFHPTAPGLVCCNDFKGGSKARCSSSTNSSGVTIPSAKNVTDYPAVALVSIRRGATLGPPIYPRLPTCPRGARGAVGRAAPWGQNADSDEVGHAFQIEAGHPFRFEAGHRSDLKSATWRTVRGVERMLFLFFDQAQARESLPLDWPNDVLGRLP